jgi:hypothetical protein
MRSIVLEFVDVIGMVECVTSKDRGGGRELREMQWLISAWQRLLDG